MTLQANVLVIIIMALQVVTGTQALDPEVQALLVALLNVLLRFKTTMPLK